MVDVRDRGFLSEIRGQRTSRAFPRDAFQEIEAAVRAVPPDIFGVGSTGAEIRQFDDYVADGLGAYEYEHAGDGGRNHACKLWEDDGFDHSVDLYHPSRRIAIEIEKSERKRVSDDFLKFIKGGKTQRANRKKIEFGCLIVPVNYRGSGDLFGSAMRTLEFMRSILFVEDVGVIGYVDPRWS